MKYKGPIWAFFYQASLCRNALPAGWPLTVYCQPCNLAPRYNLPQENYFTLGPPADQFFRLGPV